MPVEGQTATNRRTGERAVFQGGQWVNLGRMPAGTTPRPEYGAGAYEADGAVLAPMKGGGVKVLKPAQQPEASMRGRLAMGLAPMIQAQQTMRAMEQKENPLNRDWGAATLDSVDIPIPFTSGSGGQSVKWSPLDPLARSVGGQDYQSYTQAAKAFESQLMPIMSGAAVSPSEAERQIKAALPEMGDTPKTLADKARTRAMMLNGAAQTMNLPLPYPDIPTFGVNTEELPAAGFGGDTPPRPDTASLPQAGLATYRKRFTSGQIDQKAPQGSAANPFLARTMEQAERLPQGSHVILPDGSFGVVD